MSKPRFPWADVAIAGVYNTPQAKRLPGKSSLSLHIDAILGALADAGLPLDELDGVSAAERSRQLIYDLTLGPAWSAGVLNMIGIQALFEAAAAIASGQADAVVVAAGEAGRYSGGGATVAWTRPANEFVAPWGMFTAAEFALVARAHMDRFGTTHEQLAHVSATIRNNAHVNEEAVYYKKGPYSVQDILASRIIADPFHLLDCCALTEGGCAVLLTSAARAADLRHPPVYLLAAGHETFGPAYQHPPSFDLHGRRGDQFANGWIGRRAADRAFEHAGIQRSDVDVLEFYDPFSFEIIRQLEAFGFCKPGEGGAFVAEGNIDPGGRYPVNTDGGMLGFSNMGSMGQMLQKVIRGVQQLRHECKTRQVEDARVALCSNGGAGAMFTSVVLLGNDRP